MKVLNKSVPVLYKIRDKFEAGIVLSGSEVKAVKDTHVDLVGSHVRVIGGEAYLINAKIFPYQQSRENQYEEGRSRKLLLHKKEINALKSKLDQKNLTIVPISIYTSHNLIKLELGLASGKKQYDHRQDLKRKDLDRDTEREIKNTLK